MKEEAERIATLERRVAELEQAPLLREIERLRAERDKYYQLYTELKGEVEVLRRQLAEVASLLKKTRSLNSQNSHLAPSKDQRRYPKKVKPESKEGKRKSGGQPKHKGSTLEMRRTPDEVVWCEPKVVRCECGGELKLTEARGKRGQVYDIALVRVEVKEYVEKSARCEKCACEYWGELPKGVQAGAQYGPNLMGEVMYLKHYQHVPYQRAVGYIKDRYGHELSEGSVANAQRRLSSKLAGVGEVIQACLMRQRVLHADETGMRVASLGGYVQVVSDAKHTLYHVDRHRGRKAYEAMGIRGEYQGVLSHDRYHSYDKADYSYSHALCNAHLLRDLQKVYEDTKQTWTQRL